MIREYRSDWRIRSPEPAAPQMHSLVRHTENSDNTTELEWWMTV